LACGGEKTFTDVGTWLLRADRFRNGPTDRRTLRTGTRLRRAREQANPLR
jgi:hypothetical protein